MIVVEGTFVIKNRLGLHARAAALFVKSATGFKAEVWVEKDGMEVNGKSIMGLLMLACPLGSKIGIKTQGSDEQLAYESLGAMIENGFGEK
jgi:phosphocarrier protein HPr